MRLRPVLVASRALKRLGVLLLVVGVGGYLLLLALGYQPLVMISGSMQKTIPVGSLVVDEAVSPRSLKVGDIITFQKPLGARGIDSHRIIEIQHSNGHVAYRTKGDSNPVADPWAITYPPRTHAHKTAFQIPYLGYLLLLAHSQPGIILIVTYTCLQLLLAALKIVAETIKLKEEIRIVSD